MNKAFIILTIVMSSSLLSQTLIDLYHNDLPQNKDFSKSSVRIVLDQELAFRLNRAPEYINATLQYLHNRYDRNVLDPDSNGQSLLSALDKKSKMLADRWALNQITDLSKQNIPESAISYLTPILNEKRNRQTYSDSILNIYSSLLDSNRTSYLLLKYYLNDSSLVYRPNIDYSEQRYHYELEKISNYEHQYEQLSEKNIFDPRISIVDATKYFPLFANYHTANVFPSSYLSYSSYTSKLLALYDQSFRKSTYFIRTGYFFANKLYDYTAISVFSKDYPV